MVSRQGPADGGASPWAWTLLGRVRQSRGDTIYRVLVVQFFPLKIALDKVSIGTGQPELFSFLAHSEVTEDRCPLQVILASADVPRACVCMFSIFSGISSVFFSRRDMWKCISV